MQTPTPPRNQQAPNIGFDLWGHVACFLTPLDRSNLFGFLRANYLLPTYKHPAATQELFLKQAVQQDSYAACDSWPSANLRDADVAMLVELGVPRDCAREMLLRFGTVSEVVQQLFFV